MSMYALRNILKVTSFRCFTKLKFFPSTTMTITTQILRKTNTSAWKHTRPLSDAAKIVSVTISKLGDIILLDIADGKLLELPSIWLRDNCQCAKCFHGVSQSRTIDWSFFDFEVRPLKARGEGSQLTIDWSDEHTSTFDLEWLNERSFTAEKRKSYRDNVYRFRRVTWGASNFDKCFKKFDYDSIIKSDLELLKWLESITKFGVALVQGTPMKHDSCKLLTERVAFVRKTHYGEEFIVTAKEGTTNVAYLSAPLQLHTDLPYYHYKPGANFLHCLVQSAGQGGKSQLTDVFHVANILKKIDPESYRILTQTSVDWSDVGEENGHHFHSLHQAPVLCEDEFGDIVRVNFSQPQRDSHFNIPLTQVTPWYSAMAKLTKLLYSPDNMVTFKMNEGEILTFDNLRLVHGRTGYVDKMGMERQVIGCYLDWDEIYSRIRTLRKQVQNSSLEEKDIK